MYLKINWTIQKDMVSGINRIYLTTVLLRLELFEILNEEYIYFDP